MKKFLLIAAAALIGFNAAEAQAPVAEEAKAEAPAEEAAPAAEEAPAEEAKAE